MDRLKGIIVDDINKFKKFKRKLKKVEIMVIFYDAFLNFTRTCLMTKKGLIKKKFRKSLGREVDLVNPIFFNDKLQWLKLNWYNENACICADKYDVRNYVKEKIGIEYLNELVGVYDNILDIDISKLPDRFVLKGTHGSGFNLICKDKSQLNWKEEQKNMRRWLRTNYYSHKKEWVYKNLKPRIICEKYIEETDNKELKDYKFFCFHGDPKLIQVDLDRFKDHRRNIYDLDWNLQELEIGCLSDKKRIISKPQKLELMIELSKKLSKEFPHVRVDFYEVDGKVIFGELTFFHGSGFEKFTPNKIEEKFGSWLTLPQKVKQI